MSCMYSGANKVEENRLGRSWYDYTNFSAAAEDGAILLKQDLGVVREHHSARRRAVFSIGGAGTLSTVRKSTGSSVTTHHMSSAGRSLNSSSKAEG
jgi:hypothetical protein